MGLTLKGDDLFPILVYIRELQRRMGTDPGKCNQSRLASSMCVRNLLVQVLLRHVLSVGLRNHLRLVTDVLIAVLGLDGDLNRVEIQAGDEVSSRWP